VDKSNGKRKRRRTERENAKKEKLAGSFFREPRDHDDHTPEAHDSAFRKKRCM
jgi:hypothetical protein